MNRPLLGALVLLLAASSFGATRTWTGTTSGQWTLNTNWGGTAPSPGDDLVFPNGAANLTNANDFAANTPFNSITVGTGYTLNGNAINLGAGGLTVSSGGPTVNIAFTLTASQVWTVPTASGLSQSGGIALNGQTLSLSDTGTATPTISGAISGSGTIVKGGIGNWTLTGNNTYSGQLQINAGYLIASGANVFGVADNTAANGTIVNAGGSLYIGPFTYPTEMITLNDTGAGGNGALQSSDTATLTGTVVLGTNVGMNFLTGAVVTFSGVVTGSGRFGMGNSGIYILDNAGNDFTGGVIWGATGAPTSNLRLGVSNALPSSVSLKVGLGGTFDVNGKTQTITSLSGSGNVTLGSGGNLTITNPSSVFDGTMSGSGSVTMTGGSSIWDSPNTYTGTFTHTGGGFNLNGSNGGTLAAALTQSAGTFGVSSNATAGVVNINGGTFFPGASGNGIGNTGNLTLAPGVTYTEFINGTAAPSYGNVHVTGSVNLGGSTLTLLGSGAGVAPGNTLTIIDNDGSDPVIGTFAGLPQGATIAGGPGGLNYTISYTGGTGNDVVLTALGTAHAIPALDPRILVALMLLLGVIGFVSLRR